MAKCTKCGFDEEGNFCRQCGTPIPQQETSEPESHDKTPDSEENQVLWNMSVSVLIFRLFHARLQ